MTTQSVSGCKVLSGSALKMIALASMTVDHMAYYLAGTPVSAPMQPYYELIRMTGRLAFPIFAFLTVEGFLHTRDRSLYLMALMAAAAISQLPWVLLNGYTSMNVLLTLAGGVGAMMLTTTSCICSPAARLSAMAAIGLMLTVLDADYGWRGLCLIMVFYLFKCKPLTRSLLGLGLMIPYGITGSILAFCILLLYSGKRGFIKGRRTKYLFYAYYPAHLAVIALIKIIQS